MIDAYPSQIDGRQLRVDRAVIPAVFKTFRQPTARTTMRAALSLALSQQVWGWALLLSSLGRHLAKSTGATRKSSMSKKEGRRSLVGLVERGCEISINGLMM